MQTSIHPQLLRKPEVAEADEILHACVHCGFCNATCPTYRLLGSELDGPRGRIYLIKETLETGHAGEKTRLHLDRCLACRSCETTCPSGVRYGRLLDIGRQIVKQTAPLPLGQAMFRKAMLAVIPRTERIATVVALARWFRPVLPQHWRRKLPERRSDTAAARILHSRRMLILDGCVQPLATPNTNAAAARVLDRLGISLVNAPGAGCCGALNKHLADADGARAMMRRNIDAWWPAVAQGAEAIVITASACGLMVKEYRDELRDDPEYSDKAAHISGLARDLSEVLAKEDLSAFARIGQGTRIAYHPPCTLQHGQRLGGLAEDILTRCGYELTRVTDSHLCCGAAGTFMLTQPELSQRLLENKLDSLRRDNPEMIVSANVGCQMHLASASELPVKHWIELLEQR
jgi:glycolate oxidase iron-sulfur subunit